MIRFYKILLNGLIIALLAWLLPWLYNLATLRSSRKPFTIYSEVIGDFAMLDAGNDTGKAKTYTDRQGNRYTEAQFDSILPTFYYRQLVADNRFPDTIAGRPVTPRQIKEQNFIFRHAPIDVNVRGAKLYPLLESRSKRVDLEMPGDVFRFTQEGVEFIDMAFNSVNKEKSSLFSHVFKRKGVKLPIKTIAGNPTTRKEYDEGYFFVDAADALFHLKQMQGRPFLRKVPLPNGVKITHLFVTEYPGRRYFAFLTDAQGKFYALTMPGYELKEVATARPFFPQQDELIVFGNLFNWTIKQSVNASVFYTAVDADTLAAIDTMTVAGTPQKAKELRAYLFPFELRFTSSADKYFYPRIERLSWKAVWLNVALMIVFVLFFRRRRSISELIVQSVAVVVCGVPAFIALTVVGHLFTAD